MNREIKFRAWHKNRKKFINPDWFYITAKGDVWGVTDWYEEDITDEFELMQYTGLKDKNGTEIYEGDILKFGYAYKHPVFEEMDDYEEEIGIVEIKNCTARVEFSDETIPFSVATESFDPIEVIGNIYENPELVEAI